MVQCTTIFIGRPIADTLTLPSNSVEGWRDKIVKALSDKQDTIKQIQIIASEIRASSMWDGALCKLAQVCLGNYPSFVLKIA